MAVLKVCSNIGLAPSYSVCNHCCGLWNGYMGNVLLNRT